MTYAELKAKIDAVVSGTDATTASSIGKLEFHVHSQADQVKVGYDPDKDQLNVVQVT